MNRLFLGFLGFVLASMTAGTVLATEWAEKMFAETSHDFRTVGRGTTAEFRFEFKNLYEEEVHVSAVRSSCGCTSPQLTKESLATHESAAVVATLNTSTFIGQKSAVLTVVFDRPYYAEVQLKVSGYISTNITFDPPEINFGDVGGGETPTRTIAISHRGNPDWRITDVRSHCSDLQAKLGPPELKPGEVKYLMTVRMKETMSEGDIHERLTLVSNDKQFPTVEMSVDGRVRPALAVSPAAVSLGTAKVGETVTRRLLVRGENEFTVVKVNCPDKRFTFELPEGKKKLHFVNVNFAAGEAPDRIAQRLEIVTDLPGDKSTQCVVTGTIK